VTPPPVPGPLAEALRAAGHVAILTGAGISAESGIPTFREAMTGLWARYSPQELATPEAFARDPDRVWNWYRERRRQVAEARPNAGHAALALLERRVPRVTLVTQNVDGLHAAAGSTAVVELHGNIRRVRCAGSGHPVEGFDDGDLAPRCPRCRTRLRPDVVWFGELLPREALDRAWAAAETCDVFLSIGTSNLVEPAASLPWIAARRGVPVAVVNTSGENQLTGARIFHLLGPAGTVLPALLEAAWPGAAGSPSPAAR
jgi:NAD-dependent deacetylase